MHSIGERDVAEYSNATVIGERYRNPTEMIYSHYLFAHHDCDLHSYMEYTVTSRLLLRHLEGDKYKVKSTNTTFSFTEYGLEKYHCEPAIKPNTFYPLQYSFEYFY